MNNLSQAVSIALLEAMLEQELISEGQYNQAREKVLADENIPQFFQEVGETNRH